MNRVNLVYGFFVFIFLAIIVRLFYWQIIIGDSLKAEAFTQYLRAITLPAQRGSIIDINKSPIVLNQPAYLIYAKPFEIKDNVTFVDKLASVIPIDKKQLMETLNIPGRLWVPIAKKIDSEVKNTIQGLGLSSLGYEKESKRFYPEASMAAHLLGFVGQTSDGADKGYFGLEGYYDRYLKGKNGLLELEQDPSGTRILLDDAKRIEPENGRTIQLWLNKSIQYIAERHLQDGIIRYGAKEGSVIIMEPQSGGILAMASIPTYDPVSYSQYANEYFKNPVVSSSYEPGSTFKVLIMAKAIDLNVIKPNSPIDEDGPMNISGYTIRTWNDQYHGSITATQVLVYSSNVGMVKIGQEVGKDRLLQVINQLEFGSLTGIDLQDEESPNLRAPGEWSDIDIATLTFGQGIAVTPIQMVRAVASIANSGWLMEPHMVKSIQDEHGKVTEIKPKRIRQVFKASTAHLLSEMMVTAVDNGEAKWAKPKGYSVAGKTGTAQIPVAGHYDEKKTIASFVGFAPAQNPRFVMLVTLREPSSSPWGSETAAPLFFSIAKDLFLILGIPQS